MSEKFNDTFRDYSRARLESSDIQMEPVVGSETPVKLSLALPVDVKLKPALAEHPQGVILALDMTTETAAHLLVLIQNLFREMGLPLPEESKVRDEFQRIVPQGPRRSPKDKERW